MNTMKPEALVRMQERFGKDTLLSVATVEDGRPWVRIVDAYYEDGAFYTFTYALSNKMRQLKQNPAVGVCGEWFTAHGVGENLGHPAEPRNKAITEKLMAAFQAWIYNGHTNFDDPHTCILRIRLTDGLLQDGGVAYPLDFTSHSGAPVPAE